MARKWLNSADVEIEQETGAILVKDVSASGPPGGGGGADPPASLAGGTKTVAASATPEKLVADATPCRFVWLGARVDANGNGQNTKPCFIGDSTAQNIPIMPANFEGLVMQIDDASKLYVRVGVDGEGVAYRIFS